jgi:hypothetical protein
VNKFVQQLKNLSDNIESAKSSEDYSTIYKLDSERKSILEVLMKKKFYEFSEADIQTIKLIAEHNEKIVSDISVLMSHHTKSTSDKIKMLRAYNRS